ncbi:MAG: peroxide stress protein YaaA, partial [Bacteroidota bacterium]
SGLYGLLRPMDLIQPYRLEMKTKLSNPEGKDLYSFWSDQLAEKINAETDTLINLASNEYFKALPKKTLKTKTITPVFKEFRDGKYRIIAFFAKKARGAMAKFILENRIDEPEGLKDFNGMGYTFNADLSKDLEWVFSRKVE